MYSIEIMSLNYCFLDINEVEASLMTPDQDQGAILIVAIVDQDLDLVQEDTGDALVLDHIHDPGQDHEVVHHLFPEDKDLRLFLINDE